MKIAAPMMVPTTKAVVIQMPMSGFSLPLAIRPLPKDLAYANIRPSARRDKP
jgi:hypothetical protein